jgi:hypothetical protein
LSNFNVITWFAPKNVVVANLVCITSALLLHNLRITVWRGIRAWSIPGYIRLGTNCIYWISISNTILGCDEYRGRPRGRHVVCRSYNV